MISRRTLLGSGLAATTFPQIAFANDSAFDPTPQEVRIKKDFQPGQMLILPRSYYLYFVTEPRKARRYGVGVGKAGLEFTGEALIQRKAAWPRCEDLVCLFRTLAFAQHFTLIHGVKTGFDGLTRWRTEPFCLTFSADLSNNPQKT